MKNALILLAGGSGKRAKTDEPKQFLKIGNANLIEYFLSNLDNKLFDIIIIAIKNTDRIKYLKTIKKKFPKLRIEFSRSGASRQISVRNSLQYLDIYKPNNVLIHDSARPLATNNLIRRIIKNLDIHKSCIPFIKHNDLIISKKRVAIDKDDLMNIQTPQGFKFLDIYKAHKLMIKFQAKDDSSIFEKLNIKSKMIYGEITNIKITEKKDFLFFNKIKKKEFRSGIGYDVHKIDFFSNKKLKLCGVVINHNPLIGHSDADVGYHAICDSILGALSMKDIGFHFNNKNVKWKNADSKIFIEFCEKKLFELGYRIINLDINFICETPNIYKLSNAMKKNICSLLKIKLKQISIKATTNEKVGFIGRGEAIAAESIVQITNV